MTLSDSPFVPLYERSFRVFSGWICNIRKALIPGCITSCSRLSRALLDPSCETRWVEKGNRNASFPLPLFGKGGYGGISEAVENPPKSPFSKGDFKAPTVKDK